MSQEFQHFAQDSYDNYNGYAGAGLSKQDIPDGNPSPGSQKDPRFMPIHTRVTGDSVDKLRSQNEKLKVELRELSSKLEEYLLKAKQKKHDRHYGIHAGEGSSEAYRSKQKELVSSQSRIQRLKHQIQVMRRQLEGSYNIDKIVKLEDQLKNKTRILNQLESEHQSLLTVQREQEKAYKQLSKEGDYQRKIDELSHELRSAKDRLKQLQMKQREEERHLKEQHERLVTLQEKNRKLYHLTEEKKRQREMTPSKQVQLYTKKDVTEEDIRDLEEKIKYAEMDKTAKEREYKREIAKQEQQIQQLKYELKKIELESKEKDQEYRLNELKIRELRRQIPHRNAKPADKQSMRSESRGSIQGQRRVIKKSSLGSVPKKSAKTPGSKKKVEPPPPEAEAESPREINDEPKEDIIEEKDSPNEKSPGYVSPKKAQEVDEEVVQKPAEETKKVDLDGEVNVGTPMLSQKRATPSPIPSQIGVKKTPLEEEPALELEDDYDDEDFDSHVTPSASRGNPMNIVESQQPAEKSKVLTKPFGMKKKKV